MNKVEDSRIVSIRLGIRMRYGSSFFILIQGRNRGTDVRATGNNNWSLMSLAQYTLYYVYCTIPETRTRKVGEKKRKHLD
jgi:hypothetical protein